SFARNGRIVTLGSPHGGSAVGRRVACHAWGRRLIGRSLLELWERGGPVSASQKRAIGLMKGERSIGQGRLCVRLEPPNDGVVTVDEVCWPGVIDEVSLAVSHTEMLWSRVVADEVAHFLRHGRFCHRNEPTDSRLVRNRPAS